MDVLGQKLYSEQELLREVNKEIKGSNPITGKMFIYYRDVRGMIPKPIRIRATKKPSGARSFYTQQALDSTKLIAKENKIYGKLLKDIVKEYGSFLEENKIKSDMVKHKCDLYFQAKNGTVYMVEIKAPPIHTDSNEMNNLNAAIVGRAESLIEAIKSKKSEEQIDDLLDDLQTVCQKRTKQRVVRQVEKAKER